MKYMKILIAEDNLVPRKILIDHLTKWGYEVIVTKDGNEAWDFTAAQIVYRLMAAAL